MFYATFAKAAAGLPRKWHQQTGTRTNAGASVCILGKDWTPHFAKSNIQ